MDNELTPTSLQPQESVDLVVEEQVRTEFQNLSPVDKVKAILSEVNLPCSKAYIFQFAEITIDALPDNDRAEIEQLFSETMGTTITSVDPANSDEVLYNATDSLKLDVRSRVNRNSVSRQISKVILSEIDSLSDKE